MAKKRFTLTEEILELQAEIEHEETMAEYYRKEEGQSSSTTPNDGYLTPEDSRYNYSEHINQLISQITVKTLLVNDGKKLSQKTITKLYTLNSIRAML